MTDRINPHNVKCQICGKGSLDHTDEEADICIKKIVSSANFQIDTFISPDELKLLEMGSPNKTNPVKKMDDATRARNLLDVERSIISCQKELEALHEMKDSLLNQKD